MGQMLATEKLMRDLFGNDFRRTVNSHILKSFQVSQMIEQQNLFDAFESGNKDYNFYFDENDPDQGNSVVYYIKNYGER